MSTTRNEQRQLTLGSLFDGIGGFPLAGIYAGMKPMWASEIELFPIRVTEKRLPDMKHYGDVSKLNGGELEPVDVVTFGSPCTALSVASLMHGLHGKQSVLFFQAIRIIQEMREKTNGQYPRWAVWENVPGALSSQKGRDLREVLESLIRIKDPEAAIARSVSYARKGSNWALMRFEGKNPDGSPSKWYASRQGKWKKLLDAPFKISDELSFKTKMADIPLQIQEMIFGNKIDDNGVLIRASIDKPPYFAVGFKSEKSNHKYRFVWLFKVRAKPVTETYATRAGTTVTRQTGEIEWKAIKRTHDNQYQAVADEDQNGFDTAKAEAFLQSVYVPSFNAGAGA